MHVMLSNKVEKCISKQISCTQKSWRKSWWSFITESFVFIFTSLRSEVAFAYAVLD